MTSYKLATFGCWNFIRNKELLLKKLDDNNENIPFVNVINLLKKNQEEYKDLIILGDNYYPDKEKLFIHNVEIKNIKYNDKEMNFGFTKLNEIEIANKFLIMGNHDVEKVIENSDQCIILNKQLNIKKYNIQFPYKSHNVRLANGIDYKYIFIDTTIYDIKDGDTCYERTLGIAPSILILEQQKFIIKELSEGPKNIIFFGHEPLLSIKTKIDMKEDDINTKKTDIKLLIDLIFDNIGDKIITYICADVHMYQSCEIKREDKTIKQIICGTGGAERDFFCLASMVNTYEINGHNYILTILDFDNSYGYVEIELGEILTHKLIKVKEVKKEKKEKVRIKYFINYKK